MLLDLNNASTIVEWWAVYPQRHGQLLADWVHRRPEHRGAILEARRRIKADPSKRCLLEHARTEHHLDAHLPVPLTHDEQAAGEVSSATAE